MFANFNSFYTELLTPKEILKTYWGYENFRPLQEEIIQSVLEGNDTLALMPTGGGKSLCFQVPALAKDGICIVVSPLIALMQDQVNNLKKLGVKAIALHSAMSYREIDIALDNCVYGDVKFLYVSPERLCTDMFLARFKKMKVNLIAIDEAHCVSQWGYDFRPPYLEIAKIRAFIPKVPVMALTATATSEVIDDIQDKLLFTKKNVLSKSFARSNLAYMAFREENKRNRLLKICYRIKGCGVVYVRNRKKTGEIAEFLCRNNISAQNYHAGLPGPIRQARQLSWTNNETRIIVATNAFGMGIDKPDVRFVVHLDLPEDLESYYQEAGRGGRDGNKAYAVLLWEPKDTHDLQSRMVQKFPDPEEVRLAYRALTNHLQLAAGSGQDATYSIDLNAIAKNFTIPVSVLHNSFKVLESEGYLAFNEAFYSPSRIQFIVDKHTLYDYQLRNPAIDKVIQLLLRSYSGLFEGFVKIDERDLAKRNKTEAVKIIEALRLLQNHAIIDYTESSDKPMVTFIQPCVFPEKLIFSKETYFRRKALAASKMESVIKYLDDGVCRQKKLLNYFGEKTAINCGHCDVCLKNHTAKKVNSELEIKIIETLRPKALHPDEIVAILSSYQQDLILKQVKWMVDEQLIVYNSNKTLSVKEDILIQKNDNVKND
jgi:ATP-dependent DNA helicase RecQ